MWAGPSFAQGFGGQPSLYFLKFFFNYSHFTGHANRSFEKAKVGVPKGSRTPVSAVKGQCPRPLDDRDVHDKFADPSIHSTS